MKKLIQKVKSGDEAAFQQLIDETKSMAFYTAKGILKNDQDAEEVVNFAYLHMYQKIDTLKNAEKFNSWFSKIVVNLSLNKLKQIQNREFIFSQFESDEYREDYLEHIEDNNINNNPQQSVISSELSQEISAAMDNLAENQRQCLQYYYFNDLSVGEIAELFDIPKSTVKTRLRLGRDNLKSQLEKKNIFGLSFLPAFFNSQVEKCEINIAASEIMKLSAAIAKGAGTAAASKAVGSAAAAASKAGSGAAASAAATKTASTAAKAVVAKKVIAGVVALGVATGGGVAGAKAVAEKTTTTKAPTTVTEEITEEETAQEYELVEETTLAAVTYGYDENIPGMLAVENGGNTYYSDIDSASIIKQTPSGKETTALKNVLVYQMLSYKGYIYYLDEDKQVIYQWDLPSGKKVRISKKKVIAEGGALTTTTCWAIYIKGGKLFYIANDAGSTYDSGGKQTVYAYDLKTGKTSTVITTPLTTGIYLSYDGVYRQYDYDSGKTVIYDINGTALDSDSSSVLFEDDDYKITLSDNYKYTIKNKSTGKTYGYKYLKKKFKKSVKSADGWSVDVGDDWSIEIYSLSVVNDTVYAFLHIVDSSQNIYYDVTRSVELG